MSAEETAAAIDAAVNATDDDGWVTSGWVLARVSLNPETSGLEAGYSYYMAPGQHVHVSRGLLAMAITHYDENCRSGE